MRARVIIIVTAVTAAAAGIGWSLGTTPDDKPVPSTTAADVSTSAPQPSNTANRVADLARLPLAEPGSEIYVDLPATVTVFSASNQKIFAEVTMHELTQLRAEDAISLLTAVPAAAGFADVYAMPVSLRVLGVTDSAGSNLIEAADLTSSDLNQFSVATRPGTEPLPSTSSVSSPNCNGAPADIQPITAGDTFTWCIHAFGGGTQTGTPIGGQFQATAGADKAPLLWASKTFRSEIVIPSANDF